MSLTDVEWSDRESIGFRLENHPDAGVALGCIVWRAIQAGLTAAGYRVAVLHLRDGHDTVTLVPADVDRARL